MNLGEMLKELRVNMLRDSSSQISGASDYLWDDQSLVNYINEGVDEVARRTNCLRDMSPSSITQFTTVANQAFYQLDFRVLAVLSVRMTGDYADLPKAGHNDLDTYHQPDTYFFDPSQLENIPPGKPLAYTTDEGIAPDGDGTMSCAILRLYPVPIAPYAGIVGNMRVVRLPLNPLQLNQPQMIPEIPKGYHRKALDWAASLALRGADLDVAGGDAIGRSKMFAGSFENWITELKGDLQRKMFKPAQFAFGRNGFSYENY